MKTTGEIIKTLRESRGLTQQQLANIIGAKTYTTITKWESDDNFPKGKDIVKLSEYFKVSSDYLLGIEEVNDVISKDFSYPLIPISVSAGIPLEIDSIIDEAIEEIVLPDVMMGKWAGREDIFIMHVNGDSMNNVIPHNSMIAVKNTELNALKDGDIVVYSDGGNYSVKRFYNDVDSRRLIFRPDSSDKRFTDKTILHDDATDITIHGKVVLYIVEME